ncbi:MAG: CPBP family intramembrane metalloprotease [Elusimicrobia bacterium]|nr:CPBP family intramembrane metalloprotease [Elusimicrobiota bacterium]
MNRIARFFVALSLLLAAPGLAPYQAAAQTVGAARAAVPAGSIGAAGASIHGLGGANLALPAASLRLGLVPSLTPSAALTPVLNAPAGVFAAVPSIASPAALKAVAASAAPAANAPVIAAAPVAALSSLQTGTKALETAARTGAAEAPRTALDGLFEGSAARPDALAVSARSAASGAPRLDPSRGPAQGPRWVKSFRGPDEAPATSVKRTLSVGFLAAVVPIAVTMVTVVIAQLFGYVLHPNYQGPSAGEVPTILSALAMWIGAAVMAPVSEEAIFRGGLQKKLSQLTAKLRIGDFVVPAAITSFIFVALHETSDPVLFFTRFVHALILSHVYHKEGILASMAAHGFFNGLLALSVVFSALGLPWLGLAVVPAALYFALRAAKVVRAQKPDIASGALTPKPLTAGLSFLMAGVLALGYFFLMPNIFWIIGAIALIVKGITMLRSRKA